jgi:tetratricopeptide (TPR) repeat protein
MKEKYLASVKKSLLSSDQIKKEFFYTLLKHFNIKGLKKLADFNQLKDSIISLKISPQEFEAVALGAVQKKNLDTLKFLMNECGYDLTKIVGANGVTLLHEACFFGGYELVEFLLKKGFDPNAQDANGETPLHIAAKSKANASLIPLLKERNGNLKIQNKNGLTPLFVAILFNPNSPAPQELKQGVIKYKGLNYIQFGEKVRNGLIENKESLDTSAPVESISEQAVAKYYKGCLHSPFNEQIFQEVKAEFFKSSGPLIRLFLIDVLILTSKTPFQSQSFIKELLKFVEAGKITIGEVVDGILKASETLAEQRQIQIAEELNQFVLTQLKSKAIAADEKVYYILGLFYDQIGSFLKSADCLKQAIQNLPEQTDSNRKKVIWFHLGCVQACLYDKEALESFKKAYYFDQNDEESFQYYLTLLLRFENYKEALQICEKSQLGEFSKICTAWVSTTAGDSSLSDLFQIVNANFASFRAKTLALNLKTFCYIQLGNNDQALIAAEESFAFMEENLKYYKPSQNAIILFLNTYMKAGKYEMGLKLMECFEKKYSFDDFSIACIGVLSVFYLANQQIDKAEVLIQKIRSSGANVEMLSHFYLSWAAEILSHENNTNYDLAMKYIDLTLEIDANNFKAQLYKLLISILKKKQTVVDTISQSIAPELLSDMSVIKDLLNEPILPESTSTNVDTAEIDNDQTTNFVEEKQVFPEIEEYNPVKIHQFFQKEKARLLNETISPIPKPKTKWKVDRFCFEEGMEGLIRIQHPRFSFCYAVIHPHLHPPFLKKFQGALIKSAYDTCNVLRKRNHNVQTLNKSIVQLKINEDCRLWTDTVYQVDGKSLIVFNYQGNHDAIKRKVRERKELKVINLAENQFPLVNPGKMRGIFATPPENTSPKNQPPVVFGVSTGQ